MSDTTQSTLVNKTSTNVTTANTIDSEIDPLHILLPLIGILGIAVIIAILAWKNKWRRKICFGRKGWKCFFIYSSFDWWYLKGQYVFKILKKLEVRNVLV